MKNAYYNPPYDSPIEDEFALNILKYINPEVDFRAQEIIDTTHGRFIIDFVIKIDKCRVIGIECDGKDFHDQYHDEWRDSIILDESDVTEIIRIPGTDIVYHLEDILYIISKWNPEIFSERGLLILPRIISDEAVKYDNFPLYRANFKMLSEAYEYAQICAYSYGPEGLVANRKIFLSNFLQ